MLRFVSISSLVLLLCSCEPQIDRDAQNARIQANLARDAEKHRLWANKLEQTQGTHISGLIKVWGEPEKLGNNEYRWYKRDRITGGGYYVQDGYTTHSVYDAKGTTVGPVAHIYTPKERYVAPWTSEYWCEIRVTTDKKGIITHASIDGNDADSIIDTRYYLFPFPDNFPQQRP